MTEKRTPDDRWDSEREDVRLGFTDEERRRGVPRGSGEYEATDKHFGGYEHEREPTYEVEAHPSGRRYLPAAQYFAWDAYPECEHARLRFRHGWARARDRWPIGLLGDEAEYAGWRRYAELYPHRVRTDDPWG